MTSLLPNSKKITKIDCTKDDEQRNFSCGGCTKAYKSYPALYLHIKRKHNGIRPPNTMTNRPPCAPYEGATPTGRPHKPKYDIDDVSDTEVNLESIQNSFFHLLGDNLLVLDAFSPKPKLEQVTNEIIKMQSDENDSWLTALLAKTLEYAAEYKERYPSTLEVKLDKEPESLNPNDSVKALSWFILWMGKFYIKLDFLRDLCMLVSRMWKVLDEIKLTVKDLDNKIVWRKVMNEIETINKELVIIRGDEEEVFNIVQQTCQFIDRIFQRCSSE